MTTPQTANTLSAFLKGSAKPPAKKFVARVASNKDTSYVKIAAYGKTGTGKSDAITDLLMKGLKVFILSTDMGGTGMLTVRSKLKKIQREDLLEMMVEHEITDRDNAYEEVDTLINLFKHQELASSFEVTLTDGTVTTLFAWNPDVLIWEGFSNYQDSCVVRYVLTKDMTPDKIDSRGNVLPKVEASEMRQAGFRLDDFRDWDAVKRATNYQLDEFLVVHNPLTGKKIHKYVTFHEKEPDLGEPRQGEAPKKPEDLKPQLLLSGSARTTVITGFDLVMRMERVAAPKPLPGQPKPKTPFSFQYTLSAPDSTNKLRGYYDLPETMPADFGRVWDALTAD